jgi:hypothetical protein
MHVMCILAVPRTLALPRVLDLKIKNNGVRFRICLKKVKNKQIHSSSACEPRKNESSPLTQRGDIRSPVVSCGCQSIIFPSVWGRTGMVHCHGTTLPPTCTAGASAAAVLTDREC